MKESELQGAIESLPRSIRPQRDLWPGINKQIGAGIKTEAPPRRTPYWRTPAMAAAVLLALSTGIFIGRGMEPDPGDQMSRTVLEYAFVGTLEASEREYQAAFRELVPLDYSGLRLDGAEPDALRGSWEDLQRTETELLAALQQYPADIYLNEKLLDLRSQQLQFVKQLALLEQNNWRRT